MQKRIGRMEKDFRSELSSQRYNQAKKEMRLDTDRNDSNIFYKFSDPSTIPDDSKKDISYPLARYCIVMIELYELMEELEPLMNEDKIASENLRVAKDNFAKISAELSKMEADLSKLQKDYDENMAEEKRLLDSIEDSRIKLDRAEKLNHLLKDEAIRWKESLEESKLATKTFLGNVILSSGVINYFGPLNGAFRHKLYDSWHSIVTKNGIMITERDKFSLEKIIGDTLVIRDWYNCGLPTDQVSTENGLIALNGYKWPMMIDPQMQANRWLKRYLNIKDEDEIKEVEIKKQVKEYNSSDSEYSEDYDSDPAKAMHEDLYVDGLKVINPSMDDNIFMNTMKVALERGFPVLIEDFGTTINPAIEAIVVKQFKVKSLNDSKSVKFMDEEELPVHENFRLFFTTKTANPAFLPDIFIKTNVINFTVTIKGLEDQLLGDVVKIVNPEIEQMKIENVENLSKCKKTLAKQERKILALLVSEDSSPVESPKLVESLEESERISKDIAEKVASSEKSNITIDKKREEFREVARQGSLIYFAVDDVSKITPMYQYSLQYIKKIFVTAIEGANLTQMMSPVEIRDELISLITKSIYQNVSRGLFEEHKLIFSFILCISFNMNSNKVSQDDWNLFLRGAPLASIDPTKKNPNEEFITKTGWDLACYLDAHLEKWHGICADLENNLADLYNFTETIDVFRDPLPKLCRITGANLTDFEKLLLIKIVRSDKLYYCISGYIKHNIGRDGNYFVGSLPIDMDQIYLESDPQTPIIFVLSQGADPKSLMNGLFTKIRDKTRVVVEEEPEPAEGEKPIEEHHQNHEDEHNHDKDNSHIKPFELEWNSISLGQGQGERAEKGIQLSSEKGGWMLLENCHLAKSWMPQLDKIVQKLQSDDSKDKLHKDFRLFLTSMPVAYFPIPILQNGIKITTEPPRGIKANMIRSLNAIEEETFLDGVALREPMHKLTMGLCFFHAIIQERRKFGPLGWNKIYEFNDSDLDTSKKNLFNFLYPLNEDQLEDIPWESLVYITGVINYGGRVTDNLDKRLLMSIMEQFYTVKILDKKLNSFDGYCWTDNTLYHIPAVQTLDHYKEYINNLGDSDDPDVFGLHENANIAYQSQETDKILSIVGNIQPNDGKKSEGQSPDQVVLEMVEKFLYSKNSVPEPINFKEKSNILININQGGKRKEPLVVVLLQEIDRYNTLLSICRHSLVALKNAILGTVVMSSELDNIYRCFLNQKIPQMWEEVAYPSLKPLSSWIADLKRRVEFIEGWKLNGYPKHYWLPGLFFPQGFITGLLQVYSRSRDIPIDMLKLEFRVVDIQPGEEIEHPELGGAFISGLYLDGAKWDKKKRSLADQELGMLYPEMPLISFSPLPNTPDLYDAKEHIILKSYKKVDTYSCPLYKTTLRAGELSTTGQSTNYVLSVDLPTVDLSPDELVLRGTALICQLKE